MRMYKCDICGDVFDPPEDGFYKRCHRLIITYEIESIRDNKKQYDLCPNCKAAIERFIEKRRKLNESNY